MIEFTFKYLYKLALKHKTDLVLANVAAILVAMVGMVIPLLIPVLVDEVLLEKPGFIVSSINSFFGEKQEAYIYVFIMLGVVLIARFACFFFELYQIKKFSMISENITYEIRKKILEKLEKISLAGYEFFGTGKAGALMLVDVQTVNEFLGKTLSKFIVSVLTLICVGVILVLIHWQLAIFILILNPCTVILTIKISRKVAKLKKDQNLSFQNFQEAFNETLDLFVQIKAANLEKSYIHTIKAKAKEIRNKSINFKFKSEGADEFSFLFLLVGFELIRTASILMVAYSDLSIGLMLAIFSYIWHISGSSREILTVQYSYQNAKVALERINEIFKLPSEPIFEHKIDPFLNTKSNAVTLENVCFGYDDRSIILNNISLNIKKGQKVALVGASGSGKTSLAQLIVGFYPPSSGKIKFDGIRVEDIGLDIVRNNVSIVLQNPQLFNDTIENNITLRRNINKSELENAINIAQLSEFMQTLPHGLQTNVGRSGIKLSGGQRQRLSIARMIVQNPNIVILDESTSALDIRTEAKLFSALERYLKEKTTIIIAHRFSTIINADFIYVLDKGSIIEEGTTQSLLNNKGLFYNYFKENKKG